jgi:hypothetical protein
MIPAGGNPANPVVQSPILHPTVSRLCVLCAGMILLFAGIASAQEPMRITSSAFPDGGKIPVLYTADGKNISPPLQISGVPAAAKSLVLIVDDPDAPAGTWTHWLVWNLKPDLREIPEDGVPAYAVQGLNDFRKSGYGGPSPPSGEHRYFFRLYALDRPLNLPATANRQMLDKAFREHLLATATWMGRYERP